MGWAVFIWQELLLALSGSLGRWVNYGLPVFMIPRDLDSEDLVIGGSVSEMWQMSHIWVDQIFQKW